MFRYFVVLFLCVFAVTSGGPAESRKAEFFGARQDYRPTRAPCGRLRKQTKQS
ncbi:hypothetical protein NPIL_639221, partial [Nephila pilipes]